jgi:rod shape determining protein RodA
MLRFGFGLVLMLTIAMVDMRFIQRLSYAHLRAGGVVLLVLVEMAIGNVGKGAQRWIELGGMQLAAVRADEAGAGPGAGALLVPSRVVGRGGQPLMLPDSADPALVLIPVGLMMKQPEPRHRGDADAVVGG